MYTSTAACTWMYICIYTHLLRSTLCLLHCHWYMDVYINTCIHLYIDVYIDTCIHLVYTSTAACAWMYICIYAYVYVCIYVHVYMCIYVYMYMYVH